MPAEYFPKIKRDFHAYESFRKRKKPAKGKTLELDEEKPNPGQKPRRRCVGELELESGLTKCACKIHADVSIVDRSSYTARIFADYFHDEYPCLRFCSRGRHVLNPEMGNGLKKRAIATPHFHRVDKCGIMKAYQTDTLVNNEKQIEDAKSGINFGITLFCQESNVIAPDGTSIMVKVNTEELGLSIEDPSLRINFYP